MNTSISGLAGKLASDSKRALLHLDGLFKPCGGVRPHSLEVLETRIAPAGLPTLDWFEVAGTRLNVGGVKIVGPSQEVLVQSQWSNTSGDNNGNLSKPHLRHQVIFTQSE